MNANQFHDNDPFEPLWPFHSGWAQTLAANFAPQIGQSRVDAVHKVMLPDGDCVTICENVSPQWRPGQRIVCIVHGLTGSAFSKDSSRLSRVMMRQGYRVMRINLRNAGPGFGLSKHYYNAGCSADLRVVHEWVSDRYPTSPVTQIGFSLGGNVSLKMAGEDGTNPSGNLDSLIAVCPPADLSASSAKLEAPENRLFNRYFAGRMIRHLKRLNRRRKDSFLPAMPNSFTLKTIDDLYTAPVAGFASADEYYKNSGSITLIPKIEIPTLILGAMDDPVIATNALLGLAPAPHHSLWLTKRGGHCGYIGFGGYHADMRWMDAAIVKWMGSNAT